MTGASGTILHVDMDAFFAAVEQNDHPELRGKPVIVGSPPNRRGVVSTASYEARRFGVHSAMPSRTAFKLCPHGVFLPVRGARYAEVSAQIMCLFRDLTPLVEPVSIDEAFLDVAGVRQRWPDPVAAARHLKARIRRELGLTASVGVASNKFLAKLASDLDKPDGLTVVPLAEDAIRVFLAPLPVTRIWGVGKVTAEKLQRRGILCIGQIQALTLEALAPILGPAFAAHVLNLAHGRDKREVQPGEREEKSISNEDTFPEDCTDLGLVRQVLIELAEKVGRRLRQAERLAGVAQIKVRFGDFRTITRQRVFRAPASADRVLIACALELFDKEHIAQPVRLVGFGVTDLVRPDADEASGQLTLFPRETTAHERRQAELDRTVDNLRDTYGAAIIKRGDWTR